MSLEIITSPAEFTARMRQRRQAGDSLGFVPTMGALHEGHLSLMRASIADCDTTAASIFVNPTQFAPEEDLEKYPRPFERDCDLLAATGVDILFAPDVIEMYPPGCSTSITSPSVALSLEGEKRPDHFDGVATVVLKLFNLAQADRSYFGQKDYQQAQVIRAMVRDLSVPIEVVVCPIVREADGLAMSSRNRYLTDDERQRALALSQCLQVAKQLFVDGERNGVRIEKAMMNVLNETVDTVDYAAVINAETLNRLEMIDQPAVAVVAAHVGSTRLIDNEILSVKKQAD